MTECGILLPKSSVHHFPQTTKRVARPVSNVNIVFQQKQNIQTQRYTSTQDNEDIKTEICGRAPLGIQPSTMNVARRSTRLPRTQHQTCVPLHVRHGGPRTFFEKRHPGGRPWCLHCVEDHTAHMRTRAQHKLGSAQRKQELHPSSGLNTSCVPARDNALLIQRAATRVTSSLGMWKKKKKRCRTDSWHCAEWKHEHHQST